MQGPYACREEGGSDSRSGAAGAELDNAVPGCVRKFRCQAGGEARAVRVVTDELSVLDENRVHGLQRSGFWGDFVQVLQHELLAGVGDVESVEAEVPAGGQ